MQYDKWNMLETADTTITHSSVFDIIDINTICPTCFMKVYYTCINLKRW